MNSFAVWGCPSAPGLVAPEQLMAAKGCGEEESDSAGHHPGARSPVHLATPLTHRLGGPWGHLSGFSAHAQLLFRNSPPRVCAHLRTGPRHRADLLAVLLLPPTPPPPDCLANRFHLILYQILCLFIKHAFIVLGGARDRCT